MINPISTTEKRRLKTAGIILFQPFDKTMTSMVDMATWETCPYHIHYSARSDKLIPLFLCEIKITKKIAAMRNLRLPPRSDLISDEPMLVAMAEYVLEKFANQWAKGLQKTWAIADSHMPHFDTALANSGYTPMLLGSLENDNDHKWHRGRVLLKNRKDV